MDWGPIIAAGVNLAQGLLKDDQQQGANDQSRENLLLQLQDNERDRAAAMARQQAASEAQKAIAEIGAESERKRLLGSVLLKQGEGQKEVMLESFKAVANAPERFNTAANVLAQILSR